MALPPYFASALFVIVTAGPAVAADLGVATPTALKFDSSAPAPIWTGLYVGANGGISIAPDGTSNGFIGGVQFGFNYQMGHWVVGLEADMAYDRFLTSSVTSEASTAWVGSLRPRLGYAMGPVLFYGTGGLAYANPDLSTLTSSGADFRLGWVAGAGIEYGLNPNMSVRLEYLHTDLSPSTNNSDHLTDDVVRLGINFRF
jgi:outer membrane immunogenic protein